MKKIILALFVGSIIVAAQTPFVREALFKIKANSNLNATTLRVTSGELALNRTATFNVELYSAQGKIIDRQVVTLGRIDLRQWLSSTNPTVFFKGLILSNLTTTIEGDTGDSNIE